MNERYNVRNKPKYKQKLKTWTNKELSIPLSELTERERWIGIPFGANFGYTLVHSHRLLSFKRRGGGRRKWESCPHLCIQPGTRWGELAASPESQLTELVTCSRLKSYEVSSGTWPEDLPIFTLHHQITPGATVRELDDGTIIKLRIYIQGFLIKENKDFRLGDPRQESKTRDVLNLMHGNSHTASKNKPIHKLKIQRQQIILVKNK